MTNSPPPLGHQPSLRASLIGPDSPLWVESLRHVPHDAYHLAPYVELMADYMGGSPRAFVAQEGEQYLFLPLIIRPINHQERAVPALSDATCPYGYPGLVVSPGEPEITQNFVDQAIDCLMSLLQDASIVSGFVRLHPLMPLPEDLLRKYGTLVYHGDTIAIDLRQTEDELWHQLRSNHRRDIRKAATAGYVARIDSSWENFDEYVDIYHQTMRRLDAEQFYLFPREHFVELRRALGDALHLCVVEKDGQVVSAGTFSEVDGIVEYLFSGTKPEHLRASPLKAMLHFMSLWAKDRGNHTLHLGGGVSAASDELFNFKLGFSPIRLPFYTWRVVASESDYRRLVQEWEITNGIEVDEADHTGFFPAYRRSSG